MSFDASTVPCQGDVLAGAGAALRRLARTLPPDDPDHEHLLRVADASPQTTDARVLHRYLLAAKAQARRDHRWWVERQLERVLAQVRPHSGLWAQRRCACLAQARADAHAQFEATVKKLCKPDLVWVLDQGDGVLVVSARPYPYGPPTNACFLGVHKKPVRLEVRTPGGRAQWYTRLDHDRTECMASRSTPLDADTVARIVAWPDPLAQIAAAWLTSGSDWDKVLELEEAGFADLSPQVQQVAARLAPGWVGSAAELVDAATVVNDD